MTIQGGTPEVWDVAVVGAGPAGLLLAGELAGNGIRVVVLERDVAASEIPRANGIVGRAAVELAKRGILAGSGLRVVKPPRFQFGPLVLRLGFGPGNPLHILPVPQRRLEELLERRAREHGAELRRGQEIVGVAQTDTDVTAEVRTGDTGQWVRARYLVGCDGARSVVRKQSGIGFPGFTSDQISRIARVTIPADQITRTRDSLDIAGIGPVAPMRPNQFPGGSFSIAPVRALDRSAPKDLYLISTHESADGANPSDMVPVEELRASVHRVLGGALRFTEATAIRSTIGNSRQADAYRAGRVFLAGDAAHLFNAGGSSLNIGLQDALDLAARLTLVLQGKASDGELDGYEAARRPAGERALQHTRAQAALSGNDDAGRALRGVLAEVVSSRSAARRLARMIEES